MSDQSTNKDEQGGGVRRLTALVAHLRSAEGCPWDREQTLASLRTCLVEEAYELLDAMNSPDTAEHREELGDVLLQVVFQACIREEEGIFDLEDVAHGVCEKLIRRHPHVFGETRLDNSADVLKSWEAIKKQERKDNGNRSKSAIAGVPSSLPALLRAQRILSKSERSGYVPASYFKKHEITERALRALERNLQDPRDTALEEAFGDLFFALAGLARGFSVDAENALRAATGRFAESFRKFEKSHDGDITQTVEPDSLP